MATPELKPDQIAQVSELVCQYITAQRGKYAERAVPLSAQQEVPLEPFFAREVLVRSGAKRSNSESAMPARVD